MERNLTGTQHTPISNILQPIKAGINHGLEQELLFGTKLLLKLLK
jgi:hypothetical protein